MSRRQPEDSGTEMKVANFIFQSLCNAIEADACQGVSSGLRVCHGPKHVIGCNPDPQKDGLDFGYPGLMSPAPRPSACLHVCCSGCRCIVPRGHLCTPAQPCLMITRQAQWLRLTTLFGPSRPMCALSSLGAASPMSAAAAKGLHAFSRGFPGPAACCMPSSLRSDGVVPSSLAAPAAHAAAGNRAAACGCGRVVACKDEASEPLPTRSKKDTRSRTLPRCGRPSKAGRSDAACGAKTGSASATGRSMLHTDSAAQGTPCRRSTSGV